MADILSLSRLRKTRARAAQEAQAAENRASFGRTKAEQQRAIAEQARAKDQVDAHKRKE